MGKDLTHQSNTNSDLKRAEKMIFSIMPWKREMRVEKGQRTVSSWLGLQSGLSKTKYRKGWTSHIFSQPFNTSNSYVKQNNN